MKRMLTLFGVSIVALFLVGCLSSSGYQCASDEQCSDPGAEGRCEATGYCSFPDSSCASGQRYSEHADELGATCVGADEDEDDAGPDDADAGLGEALLYRFTDCSALPEVASFARSSLAFVQGEGGARMAAFNEARCEHLGGQALGILIEEATNNLALDSVAGGPPNGAEGFATGWVTQHDNDLITSATISPSQDYPGFNETRISLRNDGQGDASFQVTLNAGAINDNLVYTQAWNSRVVSGANGIVQEQLRVAFFDNNSNSSGQTQTQTSAAPPSTTWRTTSQSFDTPTDTSRVEVSYRLEVAGGETVVIVLAAPQVERGDIVTSPIASNSGIERRAADELLLATTELTSRAGGTLVLAADMNARNDRSQVAITGVTAGTTNFAVYRDDDTATWRLRNTAQGGGNNGALTSVTPAVTGPVRLGIRLVNGQMSLAVDGTIVPDTMDVASFGDLLMLGKGEDDDDAIQGHIRSVSYFDEVLSDERLREVTAR